MENKPAKRIGIINWNGSNNVLELHRSGVKIAELKEADSKLVAGCLIKTGHMMGIKEPPDDMQLNFIMQFLLDHYRDFSLDEITNAFLVAAAGKLDIDAEDYNSFDIPYIGKVLNAYRIYRARKVKKERQDQD